MKGYLYFLTEAVIAKSQRLSERNKESIKKLWVIHRDLDLWEWVVEICKLNLIINISSFNVKSFKN